MQVRDVISDLRAGDVVTVECEHEGQRMIAVGVVLVDLGP